VNEFDLIAEILAELAETTAGTAVRVGPGDDAAVTSVPGDAELVSSIDALVADVHFPASAGASLVGYRALMVSLSDLAAMGAHPGFALVALTLPELDVDWARGLARGMASAARAAEVPIVGGNIASGPLTVTVSVHGWAPLGQALLRTGARPGDQIYLTGSLGGAAAALARGGIGDCVDESGLDELQRRYFLPQARLQAGVALREVASSAIDVSDGLLQDLDHICQASDVAAEIHSEQIPVIAGAQLDHALTGGDDYELCFTSARAPADIGVAVTRIGAVSAGSGITLDGRSVSAAGYQHFS
jgi:thiamine-monophosphate kinase